MNSELDLLKSVATSLNIINYDIEYPAEDVVKKGDGYGAEIKAVFIKDKSSQNGFSLIIKSGKNFEQNEFINRIFQREIYFYDKIALNFKEFLRGYNKLRFFDLVPICYGSNLSHKFLVLENLKDFGYKLWKRQIPITNNHAELVFQEYGKFHAVSLAFNAKNPEKYQNLIKEISKPAPPQSKEDDPKVIKYNEILFENTCRTLTQFDQKDYLEAFKEYWTRRIDLGKVAKIDLDQYSVVLHGDAWVNNYLFKYKVIIFSYLFFISINI